MAETWLDLIEVDPSLVTFRHTVIFTATGETLASTPRSASLNTPDRPDQEFASLARCPE